jgi:hypothetical protein
VAFGSVVACARTNRNVGRYDPDAPIAGAGDAGSAGEAAAAGRPALSDACVAQFVSYGDYRSQVAAEFSSFGCTVDSDCLAFYDQSACDPSCVLLITGARRGVVDRLNNFETSNCATDCWPQPWTICPAATPPSCVSGQCQ